MVRQSERVLDQQLRANEVENRKAEQLLTLGVAALGGGAALALFALSFPDPAFDGVAWGIVGIGAGANVSALLEFVRAYVGLGSEFFALQVGPEPAWLGARAHRAGIGIEALRRSLLASAARYYRENQRLMRRNAKHRTHGILLLLATALSYGAALSYIVVRGMVE